MELVTFQFVVEVHASSREELMMRCGEMIKEGYKLCDYQPTFVYDIDGYLVTVFIHMFTEVARCIQTQRKCNVESHLQYVLDVGDLE